MKSPRERLEIATREPDPSTAVFRLARALRDEGMTQLEMYRLYDEFRAIHDGDVDDTIYDSIVDTMDLIVGWCSPVDGLYDTPLRTDPKP